MTEKEMVSSKELSEIMDVHMQTIYNWRKEGMPNVKLGYKLIRYDLDEVFEWLKQRGEKNK